MHRVISLSIESAIVAFAVLALPSLSRIETVFARSPDSIHSAPVVVLTSGRAAKSATQCSQDLANVTTSQQAAIVSDDFSCHALAPFWTFVQPLNDGTLAISDGKIRISVPEGTAHDVWGTEGVAYSNTSQRIMQPASDTDFEVEVKFDSGLGLRYQMQGIMIQQDYNSLLRLEFLSNGLGTTNIYTAKFQNGLVDVIGSRGGDPVTDEHVSPLYMRVKRVDDQWTVSYSLGGGSWQDHVTFTHPMIVTEVGVYAGNSKEVAHTAVIDYFYNTQKPGNGGLATHEVTTGVEGSGSVALNPDKTAYGCGDLVSVTAVPENGWRFLRWSGDVTGTGNPVQLTVAADQTVIAHFVKEAETYYEMTVNTAGNGSVTVTPLGPYIKGEAVVLTAQPEGGWGFIGWSGDLAGTENPSILTITRNHVVTATYSSEVYFVDVQVEGEGAVDISPSQERAAGQDAVLTATPSDGWRFTGWSEDLAGTENPIMLTVSRDHKVIARFARDEELDNQNGPLYLPWITSR